MSIIQIKKLTKTYHDTEVPVHAVNGIDLNFEEGEFTAIVGPSGCGKTTLMNMIGGLEKPTSGSVLIGGSKMSELSSSELIDFRLKNIGFVFQAYNLIPVLTAKENVEFIMQLQNWDRKNMDERTIALLESVGLGDKLNSKPNQLSGGQQQRVAVARALASKPKFILADEPTANLDSKATTQLLDIMEKLNKEENITFIFATHDQRVMDKARRVITLVDGKVFSDTGKE
ncbi:ABC transporter ATP-binding protein [Lutimonas zeaxanthinifaciens]|uniref:ABC transporter ATP-binding protein n=1 Tax=Lutimonas zeaxanthinifaciens TaxID=3060215 RepID=UPI00265D5132|nr:ABC transporter ATP-binding protein [Lutimonas sp. YSD2104]WKK65247.1 ABC transporter ATP-binding protein [Lutimonas sp. YSD2104]